MHSSIFRLSLALTLIIVVTSITPIDSFQADSINVSSVSIDSADAANASLITSNALVEAKHILRSAYETSITQAVVSNHLEALMRAEGADGALSFPTLVMSGYELTIAHGNPLDDATHVIDPAVEPVVMIDIGSKYNGHCSDVTRTFFYETATQEMLDAYSAVLAAEEAVIEAISPGVEISTLDAIMEVYLEDYADVPGISLLTYWGHGVGEYVHEMPILYNVVGELAVDDVLAIEPGIYSEAGWAVRIEDTVRVTATGVEILSDAPKSLNDVMVLQSQPYVDTEVGIANYAYGSEANIAVLIRDSASRSVLGVDWYNGYSWVEMDNISEPYYSLSYPVNYSYSGQIECFARVHLSNDTYYYRKTVSVNVEASEQITLNPVYQLDDSVLPPGSLITWSYSQPGAELIRIHFRILNGGHDQLLVEDSFSGVVSDYRGVHEMYVWTPWVSGDTLTVRVVATEPVFLGGVDSFSFTIDAIEFFDKDIVPTTTPTPTQTTTTPETTTTETTGTTSTAFSPPTDDPEPSWLSPVIMTSGIIVVLVVLVSIRIRRS